MKQTTRKVLETPNLENNSSNSTIQKEREASPTPLSQFSLKTKGKQRTYTPITSPKLATLLGNTSENLLAPSTNLEINQQKVETVNQPPKTPDATHASNTHADSLVHEKSAPLADPNTNQKIPPKKSWTGLFTQKERGPSTYKVSAPVQGPKSKNENAMIISIMALHEIESDIILKALNERYADILLGTKFKFTKNGRTHLELIFHSYGELKIQLAKGIDLLGQNFKGYFASAADRTYLNITFRNMPIYNKQALSNNLYETFEDICTIASIKPMVYSSTKFLSD